MRWGSDGWLFYRLFWREVVRSARRTAFRLTATPDVLTRARVKALIIAPHDLRTSDATFADDIRSGLFVFAGRSLVTTGRSPFDYTPPSPEWAAVLYGFGWLRHLRAADTATARANARAFVSDFLAGRGELDYAKPVPVTARRLIAFLCQSPLVLEGADHAFYQHFLKAVGRDARDLERSLRFHRSRTARLQAAVALCYAGLCCDGLEAVLRRATRTLARELERQILPDGGHRSRDPGFAMELLLDLLPLRQSFVSRSFDPPEALLRAIDRMLPYLRMMRQGDASLSHFNGMGATAADHLATLLIYHGGSGEPMRRAPQSGYERLERGGTIVVADVGANPNHAFSALGSAGCLSFEMSSGPQRLVVNCGMPSSGGDLRQAARSTAAHSTANVDDTSQSHFLDPKRGWWIRRGAARWLLGHWGPIMLRGPRDVAVERTDDAEATTVSARHDGYVKDFGILHERRWRLSANGHRLTGEDAFPRSGRARRRPHQATLRFHLHPTVQVEPKEAGRVGLLCPRGERWSFSVETAGTENPSVKVEDSIYFSGVVGASRCKQLVLSVAITEDCHVRWTFARLADHPASPA